MTKQTVLLATVLIATSFSLSHAKSVVGEAAPDFTATDSNGKTHKLSEYHGKYVVLEWTNHGCPFVKKHYDSGNMQKAQQEASGKGVIWLSVNSSAPGKEGYVTRQQANQEMSTYKATPSAIILDPDGKLGKLYEAKTTPHMYVINPSGVLIYKGAIDNKPSADQADIAGSTNYVLQALTEAMAGKPITTPETKAYGCSVKYKS